MLEKSAGQVADLAVLLANRETQVDKLQRCNKEMAAIKMNSVEKGKAADDTLGSLKRILATPPNSRNLHPGRGSDYRTEYPDPTEWQHKFDCATVSNELERI